MEHVAPGCSHLGYWFSTARLGVWVLPEEYWHWILLAAMFPCSALLGFTADSRSCDGLRCLRSHFWALFLRAFVSCSYLFGAVCY